MRDIATLDKSLLNSEFEIARAVFELARGQGHGPLKAAAIVYRHGVLDGMAVGKEREKKAYDRLHEHMKVCKQASGIDEIKGGNSDE